MAQTQTRTNGIAQAVTYAQRLANADGRAYVVSRGHSRTRPLVEPLAGLELVSPQGSHRGLTVAEIVAAERSAAR